MWFIFLPTYADIFLSFHDSNSGEETHAPQSPKTPVRLVNWITILFRLYYKQDTFTSSTVKGIGGVGFEPTHPVGLDLQSSAALQLDRPPLIKAYVQPQLIYYLPKRIFISGLRFITWTLPMFPIPTDEACQSPTSILQSPTSFGGSVITSLGHFH